MKATSTSNTLLSLLFFTLTLTSCGAGDLNKKADATANTFYSDIQKKNYAAAIDLCSDKAFATDSKEAWAKSLEKNAILLGNIKSFTKTNGFNISASTTTGTMVTVVYDVQWQYGKSLDSVTLIKEKDGSMKIYNYRWNHKDATYIQEVGASSKQASQYMDDVKAGNYDAALALCSDDALKITPKESWKGFLDKATTKLGPISGYSIVRDSCEYHIEASGQSGQGNYYDIYVKSQRGNNEVMEKITFFQKNYEQPVKLVGHTFL